MKRKWLFIGVAIASVFQFSFERFWQGVFTGPYTAIKAVEQTSDQTLFSFFSHVAFAFVVGFFYLHVHDNRRSTRTGATIGAILGFLIGSARTLDWYASFKVFWSVLPMEILKTTAIGIICGVTISLVELKTNPRLNPGAIKDSPYSK